MKLPAWKKAGQILCTLLIGCQLFAFDVERVFANEVDNTGGQVIIITPLNFGESKPVEH